MCVCVCLPWAFTPVATTDPAHFLSTKTHVGVCECVYFKHVVSECVCVCVCVYTVIFQFGKGGF